MIKKILIQNYQSHKKTEINLVDGVNVITGRPQSGKTAILRALYWLIYNRPLGFRYHSHFAGEEPTQVMVNVDGKQIWHVKDNKDDTYLLGNKPFDKVNKGVPDQVIKILNISELNIQQQLDTPFLITGSAGEVAKTINRITRLEKVDIWTSDLTKSINQFSRDRDRLTTEIKEINHDLARYDRLKPLGKLIAQAQTQEKIINGLRSKEDYLRLAIAQHLSINRKLNKFKELYVLENLYKYALKIEDDIQKDTEQINLSKALIDKTESIREIDELTTELEKALKLLETIESEISECDALNGLITELVSQTTQIKMYNDDIKKLKSKYSIALKKHGKCPYCNTKITNKIAEEIAETI